MGAFFRMVTRWTPPEIAELESGLASGQLHPRDVKMKLAYEIVAIYHSDELAEHAQVEFVRVFQKGDLPEDIPEFKPQKGQTILEVLLAGEMVTSKSEGRRMLEQSAVRLDGETLKEPNQPFPHPGVLQVGKRKYLRILA
jgi:tyrosyl-tRNA synthetase